jgi:hypothetical protein
MPPRSRGAFRPSFGSSITLSEDRGGAGKAGWPLHPGLSRRKKLRERENHRYRRRHSGLPCAAVLRLIGALLGEPSRLPPSPARCVERITRELGARSLGRQDHTTSPSAKAPLVSQRPCVHRIPASRVVTTAIRPLHRGGMSFLYAKSKFLEIRIFLRAWIDSNSQAPPGGQITPVILAKVGRSRCCSSFVNPCHGMF